MTGSHRRTPKAAPRRLIRAAVIGSLVVAEVVVVPAARADESSAVCVAAFSVTLTPGLGLEKTTFRYSSNGQSGTVACIGSIGGHAVTGPGTLWDEGVGTGSCNNGTLKGFHEYVIPTEVGPVTIRRPVEGMYVGVVGNRDSGRSYPGGFVFYPTQGDCLTAPATRADAVAHGIVLG